MSIDGREMNRRKSYRNIKDEPTEPATRWRETSLYRIENIELMLKIIMWASIIGSALLAGIFVRLLLS